jgi:hypothetical protein
MWDRPIAQDVHDLEVSPQIDKFIAVEAGPPPALCRKVNNFIQI